MVPHLYFVITLRHQGWLSVSGTVRMQFRGTSWQPNTAVQRVEDGVSFARLSGFRFRISALRNFGEWKLYYTA